MAYTIINYGIDHIYLIYKRICYNLLFEAHQEGHKLNYGI